MKEKLRDADAAGLQMQLTSFQQSVQVKWLGKWWTFQYTSPLYAAVDRSRK